MAEFNFLKELSRMVKANRDGQCTISCRDCPVYKPLVCISCRQWMLSHPEEATEIVRKWNEEHPRKTRQSEFLKMYPNAEVCGDKFLFICPLKIDKNVTCHNDCPECRKRFWSKEIE